jgi:biopolymer transport protein TolR
MGADVSGGKSAKSEPNVVPLCDILLVLLIIFMIITPMIQKGANVELPEARNTMDQPDPAKIVSVSLKKSGEIFLNDKAVLDISKLPEMINEKMEELQLTDKKVLLKADINCEYGKVVDVMNAIKDGQIEIIGLITEKAASSAQ